MSSSFPRPSARASTRAAGLVAGVLFLGLVLASVLVLAITLAASAQVSFPDLSGRVVDQAGLLGPADQQRLSQALAAHEQNTGEQLVVATVKSLQGLPIEQYGYQLGRHWGIGEEGEDTGALLIVAPDEREVRIEVGYGLEGRLTDAASKLIIENVILPEFRAGAFAEGIVAGAGAILQVLGGEPPGEVAAARRPPPRERDREGFLSLIPMIFIGLFFMFARGGGLGRRRRRRYLGGIPWYVGGMGAGMGGRSGGGMRGGGFSGGGGSFGGGGASGSW